MNDMKIITLWVPSDADLSYKTAEVDGLTLGVLTRISADTPMYISGVLNHYLGRISNMNEEEEKNKTCFILFYDWEPLLRMLPREDIGDLLLALYDYEVREQTPPEGSLSPLAMNLFTYLSKLFDENKKLWYDKRKAGSKGGKKSAESKQTSSRPQADLKQTSSRPQAEGEQIQPKDKDKDKDKDKVSPNGDKKREYKRDSDKPNPSTPKPKPDRNKIPPDIEKVREYCQQRNSSVDPDYFFNYYEGQGWIKANGQKIKDWQATIRTWEEGNKAKGNPTTTQTQNSVTDWDKIAKEVEQLGYFDDVNNHANVFAGIPATVREDVGG